MNILDDKLLNNLELSEIEIDNYGSNSEFKQHNQNNNTFSGFSKINVFIGKNNSGKSRFIRTLAQEKFKRIEFSENRFSNFISSVEKIITESGFKLNSNSLSSVFDGNPSSESINVKFEPVKFDGFSLDFIKYFKEVAQNIKTLNKNNEGVQKLHELNDILKDYENVIGRENAFHRCYIPVLRGSHPLEGEEGKSKDYYFDRINKIYSLNAKPFITKELNSKELQIFTGKSIYNNYKTMLLGSPIDRELASNYQNFLSVTFFQGKEVTLIPNEESNGNLELMIEGDEQRRIYDVGDGLGQMIIITFPIFMRKESTLFFIEEPDLFMHPGMQRVLIDAMLKNDQHQYFLTTHSNHLMDIALEKPDEIKLFMIQKENNDKFNVKPMTDSLRQINYDLGVRNTSVLLANASIWVEGVTDKLYLKSFMKKYLDDLKANNDSKHERYSRFIEDFHYIFVEYQGSNLPHFDFSEEGTDDRKTTNVEKLIGNAIVLLDGDVKEKGDRVKILQNALTTDNVIVLDCKEIENLLPEEIIKPVAQGRFDKRMKKETDGRTLDLEKLKFEKYSKDKKGIGKHLDDCITGEKYFFSKNNKKNDAPGTINLKVQFCEAATILMDDGVVDFRLSEELIKVIEKIFKHIEKCNTN